MGRYNLNNFLLSVSGWQENPVDFDSVFNESRLTFAWGSYDVVPMFATKAAKDHVITDCYGENMIDFADKDGARLDEWVFNRVEKFFQEAKRNHTLNKQLNDDKLVFFLHLLGESMYWIDQKELQRITEFEFAFQTTFLE